MVYRVKVLWYTLKHLSKTVMSMFFMWFNYTGVHAMAMVTLKVETLNLIEVLMRLITINTEKSAHGI